MYFNNDWKCFMKKIKNDVINFIKGIAIGGTMMVPGVSGGTMALILGIYDDIIHSISTLFSSFKKNVKFLSIIGIGSIIGLITIGMLVNISIENFRFPTMFLFLGVVLGGFPVLFKEANKDIKKKTDWLFFAIGIIIILTLILLENNINSSLFDIDHLSKGMFIYLIIAGIIISVALILPGISTSFLLLTLGLFDPTIEALKTVNLNFLIPLIIGILLGIILTTRILESLLDNHPRQTYLMIIGFVTASIVEVFPGIPLGFNLILSIITFISGYLLIKYISKKYPN